MSSGVIVPGGVSYTTWLPRLAQIEGSGHGGYTK
jgi:hypothetical protein